MGAAGRMGQAVIRVIAEQGDTLHAAVDRSAVGDAGTLAGIGSLGVSVCDDLDAFRGADVVVDFSLPEAARALYDACAAARTPVVSGTTGLRQGSQEALEHLATRVPVVHAPNFSQGVTLLFDLAERAARMAGPTFDAEIVEIHHRKKVDSPSGTANRLAQVVADREGLQRRSVRPRAQWSRGRTNRPRGRRDDPARRRRGRRAHPVSVGSRRTHRAHPPSHRPSDLRTGRRPSRPLGSSPGAGALRHAGGDGPRRLNGHRQVAGAGGSAGVAWRPEGKSSAMDPSWGGMEREVRRWRDLTAHRRSRRHVRATRRCVMRKAFLGWWDEGVDRIWVWCLAAACARCGVTVHHAVRVGSHYHLTFTVTRNNLGEFLWSLNHSMSCALNALLDERGYEAPGQIFDGRQMHVMRVLDAEAQMASLVYERLNPVEAGLADTCDGIPGVVLGPARWRAGGYEQAKPPVFFASGPERQRLTMGPPPLLYLAFGGEVDALVHHLRKLEREGERRIRKARNGRPARTAAEVRAIDPFDEPRTGKERGRRENSVVQDRPRARREHRRRGRGAEVARDLQSRRARMARGAPRRHVHRGRVPPRDPSAGRALWRAGRRGGGERPRQRTGSDARRGQRVGGRRRSAAGPRPPRPGARLHAADARPRGVGIGPGCRRGDRRLSSDGRQRRVASLEARHLRFGAAPTPPPKPSPSKDEGQSPVDPRDGQRRGRRGNDHPSTDIGPRSPSVRSARRRRCTREPAEAAAEFRSWRHGATARDRRHVNAFRTPRPPRERPTCTALTQPSPPLYLGGLPTVTAALPRRFDPEEVALPRRFDPEEVALPRRFDPEEVALPRRFDPEEVCPRSTSEV